MRKFNLSQEDKTVGKDVNIRGIVFDIDGTLLDHNFAQKGALNHLYAIIKDSIPNSTQQEFSKSWRTISEHYMNQYLEGRISFKEQRILRVQNVLLKWDYEISSEKAWKIFQHYLENYEKYWTPYQDVIPCLNELKKYKLGIISNGDSIQQRKKLTKTELASFFTSVIVSNDINKAKPHHYIFERCAEDMNLSLNEIVYVGDNLKTDVIGALNAGAHAIWINRNEQKFCDGDTLTIFSLSELSKIIKTITKKA